MTKKKRIQRTIDKCSNLRATHEEHFIYEFSEHSRKRFKERLGWLTNDIGKCHRDILVSLKHSSYGIQSDSNRVCVWGRIGTYIMTNDFKTVITIYDKIDIKLKDHWSRKTFKKVL